MLRRWVIAGLRRGAVLGVVYGSIAGAVLVVAESTDGRTGFFGVVLAALTVAGIGGLVGLAVGVCMGTALGAMCGAVSRFDRDNRINPSILATAVTVAAGLIALLVAHQVRPIGTGAAIATIATASGFAITSFWMIPILKRAVR